MLNNRNFDTVSTSDRGDLREIGGSITAAGGVLTGGRGGLKEFSGGAGK